MSKNIRIALLLTLCITVEAACSSRSSMLPLSSPVPASAPDGASASHMSLPGVDVVATGANLEQLGVKDAGTATDSAKLSLAVTLSYRNQSALDSLVAQQSNPASVQYRHWLSNSEFDARFAPSNKAYRSVLSSLRRAGFQVDRTYENRTVIDATASVATIERYFRTSIHRVRGAGKDIEYANVDPAYAPATLRGVLLGVDGLNTVAVVHPYYKLIGRDRDRKSPAEPQSPTLYGPVSSITNGRGYSPLAFAAGYDLPVMHATGTGKYYDGTGRASGIVIDADFAESDLRQFLATFKIARTGPATRRVLLHGGPPPGDGDPDSIETTLDAEALVGDAPGTALTVYEIPKLSNANITDAYNTVVSQNVVDAVNSSFGGCEVAIGPKAVTAWSALAEQGASKGITFHASSGDSGGLLCASAPASSPYFVAVGGTALNVGIGGAWANEAGWSGSGGGTSSLFARPVWQATVAGMLNRGRNVPDIALDADPATGIALYYEGTWNTGFNPLGGTSLSSPLMGAAIAELDQVKNGRLGLAARDLYAAFAAHGYASASTTYFHDITQGSNGPFYAGTGYDLVTGIGSLDVWNLASIL